MAEKKTSRAPAARPRRAEAPAKTRSTRAKTAKPGEGKAPAEAVAGEPPAQARRDVLLREAARLFGEKGYENTSMRDIASAYGILPGSLYHHFRSKDELFVAVYAAGIDQIIEAVEKSTRDETDPWRRLEAACEAHLTTLLDRTGHAAVVIANWPSTGGGIRDELVRQRDRYEKVFRKLAEAAPLPRGVDPTIFRLGLLGALNWALTWYRPGRATPAALARKLVALFRRG